jgi:hypothetical protein
MSPAQAVFLRKVHPRRTARCISSSPGSSRFPVCWQDLENSTDPIDSELLEDVDHFCVMTVMFEWIRCMIRSLVPAQCLFWNSSAFLSVCAQEAASPPCQVR